MKSKKRLTKLLVVVFIITACVLAAFESGPFGILKGGEQPEGTIIRILGEPPPVNTAPKPDVVSDDTSKGIPAKSKPDPEKGTSEGVVAPLIRNR